MISSKDLDPIVEVRGELPEVLRGFEIFAFVPRVSLSIWMCVIRGLEPQNCDYSNQRAGPECPCSVEMSGL